MRQKQIQRGSSGQALVMLLVFMVLAVTVTSAAVGMLIVNSVAASKLEQGMDALGMAESGAEEALLRLLRNEAYAGETLTIGNGNVTVSVAGNNPVVISAKGVLGSFARTVQVQATIANTVVTVSSWQEVP